MSTVKERIIGAVEIMSEKNAAMVWDLIRGAFALSGAEEDIPDADELKILKAYEDGDPDYQPAYSSDEVMKMLGLS